MKNAKWEALFGIRANWPILPGEVMCHSWLPLALSPGGWFADPRGERLGPWGPLLCVCVGGGTAGNGRSCLIVNQALLFPPFCWCLCTNASGGPPTEEILNHKQRRKKEASGFGHVPFPGGRPWRDPKAGRDLCYGFQHNWIIVAFIIAAIPHRHWRHNAVELVLSRVTLMELFVWFCRFFLRQGSVKIFNSSHHRFFSRLLNPPNPSFSFTFQTRRR